MVKPWKWKLRQQNFHFWSTLSFFQNYKSNGSSSSSSGSSRSSNAFSMHRWKNSLFLTVLGSDDVIPHTSNEFWIKVGFEDRCWYAVSTQSIISCRVGVGILKFGSSVDEGNFSMASEIINPALPQHSSEGPCYAVKCNNDVKCNTWRKM